MKFKLTRAADYEYIKPISKDSIFTKGFDFNDTNYEEAKKFCSKIEYEKRENGQYTVYVTIDNLDSLMKFCKIVGNNVIIRGSDEDRKFSELCIYDGYVE